VWSSESGELRVQTASDTAAYFSWFSYPFLTSSSDPEHSSVAQSAALRLAVQQQRRKNICENEKYRRIHHH